MSVLANGSRALAHRNYRLFFVGQLISLIGMWMQQVAQAWLVLQITGDPFLLGLTAAVQFLPVMVLGLFGGLIADALPKRPTLIVTQVVQMALALILFGLTAAGVVEVWHILVLAALLGITNAVDMPTRRVVVGVAGRGHVQGVGEGRRVRRVALGLGRPADVGEGAAVAERVGHVRQTKNPGPDPG